MEYKDLTIKEYNELLQTKKATPGGGSALAITLSTAISLCQMVINFTIEKKGFEDYVPRLKEFKEQLDLYLLKAYKYSDLDSSTFSNLMAAFKEKDSAKIEQASIDASMIPFNLYLLTERVQVIADELFIKGNKNVVSDAKIASLLCYSIYPGCALNIEANIKNIQNPEVINMLKTVL